MKRSTSHLNQENLAYICNNFSKSFQLSVSMICAKGKIVHYPSPEVTWLHPLYKTPKDLLRHLYADNSEQHYPVYHDEMGADHFFTMSVVDEGKYLGCIIVGPCAYGPIQQEEIDRIAHDFNMEEESENLRDYFQSLPILNQISFVHASMNLYYLLYQKPLDIPELLDQNHHMNRETQKLANMEEHRSKSRQQEYFHIDPLLEKKIFGLVQEGKKEEIIKNIEYMMEQTSLGLLSKKSHLRNLKNLAISAITLTTRAAIDGGLPYEMAFSLSDLYIQNVEEMFDSHSVGQLILDALLDFADRVKQTRDEPYSSPIRSCQTYISRHLYEDIRLSHLAEYTSMNASYLSVLFKKEVGMTLTESIQRARVQEAQNLLNYSKYSILEIATLLNFHDQSYFTKTFRHVTGMTPKQYRDRKRCKE
ncbi:AraC-like DNA-binding protein/ligand-binding sensor protein [Paenibacillus shirakamiensis]|uniref:AraC-like DNA-binding protein/ligand-binding sensor protein n=1 Tax=Paenibacillus shirakamiensis TaxID=1265935 RepID=A0ABS4JGG5_9BACL|nr:AraC-like DNA-binding protein/ligand-binding sensor protein [Paenibacillus shirakamiensis]